MAALTKDSGRPGSVRLRRVGLKGRGCSGRAEVRVGGSAPSAGMKPPPQEVATGCVPQVVAPAGVSWGAGFIPASGGGADARVGQPAPHGGDVRIIRDRKS